MNDELYFFKDNNELDKMNIRNLVSKFKFMRPQYIILYHMHALNVRSRPNTYNIRIGRDYTFKKEKIYSI